MKKNLVTALILVLAMTQAVCADFSPADSSVYYSAYNFDFTKSNEESGKFTVSGNGNADLQGTGYSKSYLADGAETKIDGLKLTSLQDDPNGNGLGLVHGDGFVIPKEYTGLEGAESITAVYVKEYTFDVSGLSGSSIFRIRDFDASDSLVGEIAVTNGAIEFLNSGQPTYVIPAENRQNLKITIAVIPDYAGMGLGAAEAIWVNDELWLSSDIYKSDSKDAYKKAIIPSGKTQFYFFRCAKDDVFAVKNYKSYMTDTVGINDVVAQREQLTKLADIDFDMDAVGAGKIVLPNTLNTGFTAENNVIVTGDPGDGLKLVATEAGGLGNISIHGGKGSPLWFGTNGSYTHYWEFTADISQLNEWDGYRINYKVLDGSLKNKTLCTLSVGTKYIDLGYREAVSFGKTGFVGEYIIPEGTDLTNATIGVSYDPATKELKALLNGEVIISGINHDCDSEIDAWYTCGGDLAFGNFYHEPAGTAFVLKNLNCGYYMTSKRPAEGALTSSLSDVTVEGEAANVTATLSKEGDSGYYDSVSVFVAIYDADGNLKAVESKIGKINGGETNKELTATVTGYATGDTAKAFLWEKGTIKPLA